MISALLNRLAMARRVRRELVSHRAMVRDFYLWPSDKLRDKARMYLLKLGLQRIELAHRAARIHLFSLERMLGMKRQKGAA